jgi:nicotinamidase/pyrazinamidase
MTRTFQKGTDPEVDSYSGFFDNGHRHSTGLADYLREQNVSDVYVVGLATDYCVKFTALDAQDLGFKTLVVEDACRGVELQEGDVRRALDDMRAAGVTVLSSNDIREN